MSVNICPSTCEPQFYEEDYLKKYAMNHESTLPHVSLNDDLLKDIIIIANKDGWCTCYSKSTGELLYGWEKLFCA